MATVDELWPHLINQESGGNQAAVSPKGAIGVAQVMPGTGPEAAALAGLPWDANRFRTDKDYNSVIGKAYLSRQFQDFGGDPERALAAYNAGPGATRRALNKAETLGGDWLSYLPPETRGYVPRIMSRYQAAQPSPQVVAQGPGATPVAGVTGSSVPNYMMDAAKATGAVSSNYPSPASISSPMTSLPRYVENSEYIKDAREQVRRARERGGSGAAVAQALRSGLGAIPAAAAAVFGPPAEATGRFIETLATGNVTPQVTAPSVRTVPSTGGSGVISNEDYTFNTPDQVNYAIEQKPIYPGGAVYSGKGPSPFAYETTEEKFRSIPYNPADDRREVGVIRGTYRTKFDPATGVETPVQPQAVSPQVMQAQAAMLSAIAGADEKKAGTAKTQFQLGAAMEHLKKTGDFPGASHIAGGGALPGLQAPINMQPMPGDKDQSAVTFNPATGAFTRTPIQSKATLSFDKSKGKYFITQGDKVIREATPAEVAQGKPKGYAFGGLVTGTDYNQLQKQSLLDADFLSGPGAMEEKAQMGASRLAKSRAMGAAEEAVRALYDKDPLTDPLTAQKVKNQVLRKAQGFGVSGLMPGFDIGYAHGGMVRGPGTGMSDSVPARVNGKEEVALSDGEYIVPADVTKKMGPGALDRMVKMVRGSR